MMANRKTVSFKSRENEQMHPLNPYKTNKPNFSELCDKFPELASSMYEFYYQMIDLYLL